MKFRQLLGNIVKVAVLGACAYIAINWQSIGNSSGGDHGFVSNACVDATEGRYDVSRVKVNKVAENSNGYTVKLNVTLANGEQASVACLTTPQGNVRDLSIDVR